MFGLDALMRLMAGESGGRRRWREVVGELVRAGKVAPGDYVKALGEGPSPAGWAGILFLFFGVAQLVSGAVMFFAYNWRDLPDLAKIALPQGIMILSFIVFALAPSRSATSAVSALLATAMIGVSMGVVGQVYQQGADPWTLFAIWAAFALPLALLARSDALFAFWFVIASSAYALWANENLTPRFENWRHAVPAIYAVGAFAVLAVRDFLAPRFAGPQPRWQRWLFVAAALGPATQSAIEETAGGHLFQQGYAATLALAVVAGATFLAYRILRPDRPARALSVFAAALVVGAAGLRAIWRNDFGGAGEVAIGLAISALWVVGITAGLAMLLREGRRERAR